MVFYRPQPGGLAEDAAAVTVHTQAAARRGRFAPAALCCAALFLYAVYLGAFGVLLPALGAAFHMGSAVEARLFPANFGGFIIGVLLCGTLSDRVGRKPVLLGGTALYALALVLAARAPTFGLALAAFALVGMGTGAMETVASALAADLFPDRRAAILNALQVAFGAGAAVSPLTVHALLRAGTDWRTLFLWLAAANAALILALAFQPLPRAQGHGEALDPAALRAVLRQPVFLALCLAQALYVGAESGFSSWMPTYFERRLPGGAAWAGLVVTVFWVAMTVGRTAANALFGRLPLARLAGWSAAGGAAGAVGALVWTTPLTVLGFVAWTGLCFSAIFGLVLADAGERYSQASGTAFGGVVAAGGVGGAALPWAIGILAGTALDWRGALALVPVASALLALTLLRLGRKHG